MLDFEIDLDLRLLVWDLMGPLKEKGKRRQRNPNWKHLANICKMSVDQQTIDKQIVNLAAEVLDE